jgi:cyclase
MKHTTALLVTVALGLLVESLHAQTHRSVPASQPVVSLGDLHVLPVKGNVYMLVGAGGNIALQIGDDGVLLVDTGIASMADRVVAAIKQITDKPIRWIVNTNVHEDHTGGNELISQAGSAIPQIATGVGKLFEGEEKVATIVAHDDVLKRMSAPTGQRAARAVAAWPAMTFLGDQRELYFNDEPIFVMHLPAAYTDGDSLVFFRQSDVISAGDVYINTSYPVIDVAAGGTINGEIDALNRILDIAVSKEKEEGGTYIIPGHGRLADEADVFAYRNLVTIIRDRIQDMKKKGMALAEIKAARPTLDYDRRYSTTTWSAEMFIDAVYKTLPAETPTLRQPAGGGQTSRPEPPRAGQRRQPDATRLTPGGVEE